jgi:hypothetical protein
MENKKTPKTVTNEKLVPHIPLPFEEVMKDVLKVKPPEKGPRTPKKNNLQKRSEAIRPNR